MEKQTYKRNYALIFGCIGSILFSFADACLGYGDPTLVSEKIPILIKGGGEMPYSQLHASMIAVFPTVIFNGTGIIALRRYIKSEKQKKIFFYLTILSLTHWILMHFFYVILAVIYHYMVDQGQEDFGIILCEAIYTKLSYVLQICQIVMPSELMYYFWLMISGGTTLNRWISLLHPVATIMLTTFLLSFLPEGPLKMGLKGGSSSFCALIFFIILLFIPYRESNPTTTSSSPSIKSSKSKKN